MPGCQSCSFEYPLLTTGICSVCRSLEGKSDVEKRNIKNKPNCVSCSLIYTELAKPLCHACEIHWADQIAVPASLTRCSGVTEQISQSSSGSNACSNLASAVLSSANEHRQNASQSRLAPRISRPQNSSLRKASTAGTAARALTKTQAVLTAANQKRQGSVQLLAYLWVAQKARTGEKLVQLDRFSADKMFDKEELALRALEDSLILIRDMYERSNPGGSGNFTTQHISYHAHLNKSTHIHLDVHAINGMTMDDLLQYFADHNYTNATSITARKLSIRLVIEQKYLPVQGSEEFLDVYEDFARLSASALSRPSSRISRRASGTSRRASAIASSEKRKALDEINSTDIQQQSAPPHGTVATSSHNRTVVRVSAFRPRVVYARDVPLRTWKFKKVVYDIETRKFQVDEDNIEEIMLAPQWREDLRQVQQRDKLNTRDTAYIGSGYSKNVFYARYNGKEYAFAQSKEGYTESENSRVLRAEYENLADGEVLANDFKGDLRKEGLLFPNFEFNFTGAFLGILDFESSHFYDNLSDVAHYVEFLATPLLPCGDADGRMRKFTGNDNVGPSPSDNTTSLMHAFMHYTYVMSDKTLLFCDLQGVPNKDNVLCLIDPQIHSDNEDSVHRVYWDGGPQKMEAYLNHHITEAGCHANRYCCGLQLLETIVVTD